MKVAVMQPYFFPYIGYWQLINAVDTFVLLDDVTYIKSGWINRNQILINGNPHFITVPLFKMSSNKLICETEISALNYWQKKMIKTIGLAYQRAPYFDDIFDFVSKLINVEISNLAKYVNHITCEICSFLEIDTNITSTNRHYDNCNLSSEARVIDICKNEGADVYINAIGGRSLYNRDAFAKETIELQFISSFSVEYKQFSSEFVPWLSIIDVLMFNSKAQVQSMLHNYELLDA